MSRKTTSRKTIASQTPRKNQPAPTWRRKLIFNIVLIVILVGVAYTVLVNVGSRSVPSIVCGTEVEVAAPSSAILTRLLVGPNQEVQAGQVLAELRNDTLDVQIAAAEAEIDELERSRQQERSTLSREVQRFSLAEKLSDVRGELATVAVEIGAAERAVSAAETTVQRHEEALERARELFASNALTVSELDARELAASDARQAVVDHRVALRRLQTQERNLEASLALYQHQEANLAAEAEAQLTDLDVSIRKRQGELETLLAERGQLSLRTEVDGVVVELARSEGELISRGEPVLTLITGDRIWVEAYMKPERRSTVVRGDEAEIVIDGGGRERLAGRVQDVLPVLKPLPGGEGTGGLTISEPRTVVIIDFVSPELAQHRVRPGQRVSTVLKPR